MTNRSSATIGKIFKSETTQVVSIFSAGLTLFSNAEGFLSFSEFVSKITGFWREALAWPMQALFSILNLSVNIVIASSLTSMIIVFAVGLSARQGPPIQFGKVSRSLGMLLVLFLSVIYSVLLSVPAATQNFMLMTGDLVYFAVAAFIYAIILASPPFLSETSQLVPWRTKVSLSLFTFTFLAICIVSIIEAIQPETIDDLTRDITVRLILPAVFPLAALVSKPDRFVRRNVFLLVVLIILVALNAISRIYEETISLA